MFNATSATSRSAQGRRAICARLQKLVQRNRLAFAGAAAAVAALVLALVILGVSNVRITREKNQREAALKAKDAALTAAHTSEQRAREELFASLRSQARARRYSRQMGQRLDSLAALAEAARIRVDPGLRDDAIAGLAFPDVRPAQMESIENQLRCAGMRCDASTVRCSIPEALLLFAVSKAIRNSTALKPSLQALSNTPGWRSVPTAGSSENG